jgi:2,4-dienoyl-CoA reductase-like NADH-dependent reductase (Old Yellow Enzyme family)/thioredoxin reductase
MAWSMASDPGLSVSGSRRTMQLFEPIRLGPLDLRNRIMMTVHGPRLSAARYLRYLDERSRDAALVGVHAIGGVFNFPFEPGGFVASYAADLDALPPHPLTAEGRDHYDGDISLMAEQAAIVHRNGAKVVGQIFHGGVVVGPSPVDDELARGIPHPLTANEIADFVAACALAARRAVTAGLDGIEVHAAHGYLVNQFLSPATNQRDDDFGGSPERRLRFLLAILDAVRDECGDGFPIGVRLPGIEFVEGGLDVTDVCSIAQQLERWGVAYINVSSGNYTGLAHGAQLAYVASSYTPQGPNVPFARAIRGALDRVPVIVAGRITDLRFAEQILVDGAADMIGITRALIADPRIIAKARDGRFSDVITCIGGNECHYGRTVACAVNPAAGREEELEIRATHHPRRVLVVGGGPAGLECARVAALRGHRVELVEAAPTLGGVLRIVAADPNRREFEGFLDGLARRALDAGVAVTLGERVTPDGLAASTADVVVLATGALEWVPSVPGVDDPRVVTALRVLAGEMPLGRHVLVVGGRDDHFPPLTTADFVAERVERVTLLTELAAIGQGIEAANQLMLLRRLLDRRVALETLSALHAIGRTEVAVRNVITNRVTTIDDVDTVVLACGRRPSNALVDAVVGTDRRVQVIGDCFSPRRLVHAMLDGARVGVTI